MDRENKQFFIVIGCIFGFCLVCGLLRALMWTQWQTFDKNTLLYIGILMFAIGIVLLILASTRSVLIRPCWLYWIIVPSVWLFPVNRIMTDARLGLDSGGPQWATFEAYVVFVLFIVRPIHLVRLYFFSYAWSSEQVFWLCISVVFLFLALNVFEQRDGVSQTSILVPLGIPIMCICCWLAYNKIGMNPIPALAVGVGVLLIVSLASTQLGFNKHPRNRMSYQYADYGTVTISYAPWESRDSAIREYRNGTRLGSPNGAASGDEDYSYFQAINGLQLLLLTIPFGLGIALLLDRAKNAT